MCHLLRENVGNWIRVRVYKTCNCGESQSQDLLLRELFSHSLFVFTLSILWHRFLVHPKRNFLLRPVQINMPGPKNNVLFFRRDLL